MVQRSAARYVQNDYQCTSSVTNMLKEFKWSTLEQCRNRASLIMLHKIHKQVNVNHSHLTTTRNNKFFIPHLKTKHHMNPFFPRAIQLWNGRPNCYCICKWPKLLFFLNDILDEIFMYLLKFSFVIL